MNQIRIRFVLVCFGILATCVASRQSLCAAENAVQSLAVKKETDEKRESLWQSLTKALPKNYSQIEAYGENPALTAVIFYSQGVVLKFSLGTGKIEEIQMMKRLTQINRITFEKTEGGADWILWRNGHREAIIDDRVTGGDVAP